MRLGPSHFNDILTVGYHCFDSNEEACEFSSLTEDMPDLMIWSMVSMDPLSQGMRSYLDINNWDPDRLRALEMLRYAASECPTSIKYLA